MKFFTSAAIAAGFAGIATHVVALTVSDFADFAALSAQSVGAPNINVRQYSVANNIRSGGGQFILGPTGCTADGGVIVKDGGTNCYYRQFSGPVHLSWYGVPNAGTSPCNNGFPILTCDASGIVRKALLASKTYGDGGVSTDGISIALLQQCVGCADLGTPPPTIEITEGQYFTCAGLPGARRTWDNDPYWLAPSSIVLDPSYSIVRDKNTRLSDCFIRPKWLYNLNSSPVIPPTTVLQTFLMTQNFTGTATRCTNDGCNLDDVTIAGFDICDDSSSASKAVIANVVEDCHVNEWVHGGNGGGARLQNITIDPILGASLDGDLQVAQGRS